MNVAVFCSANNDIAPDYFRAAEELGRWIGENGHTLVYGGGNSGLMECIGTDAPSVSFPVSWRKDAE